MKRIKYKKIAKNKLISTSKITSVHGGSYVVYLNLDEMSYEIKNINQQRIVRSSEKDGANLGVTPNVLKMQVRRALKKMGVKFEKEIRFKNRRVNND